MQIYEAFFSELWAGGNQTKQKSETDKLRYGISS